MKILASHLLPPRLQTRALALLFLGGTAAMVGLFVAPERTWPSLLLNGFYVTALALSAVFFLATQRLTGARWSASLRRVPEAFAMALPVLVPLMLLLYFGRHYIFAWSQPGAFVHEPAFAGKIRYLQTPWVFTRMTLALVLWTAFAWWFRRTSLRQDREPGQSLALHQRMTNWAALFVLMFAITFTLGAFDWLISLDSQWFSTMFAVYIFAGTFVQGIAAITLAVVALKEHGPMAESVSEHQLHDLGKMLFAFTVFWAYIWVAQYLLIWYGNIPEEITHFLKRTNGPWLYLFALNVMLNWVVPFTVLMSKPAKCNARMLKIVCCVLLVGHWLDLYIVIMPSLWGLPRLGLIEIPIAAGYTALLYLLFAYNLARAPIVPLHDPILQYERAHVMAASMRHEFSGAKQ